jgi:hypothetical protein
LDDPNLTPKTSLIIKDFIPVRNTLTDIIPTIYAGLDQVSREMIGIIPAVSRNTGVERVAVGQTVNVPVVPAATGGNITPASVPPDDGDVVLGNVDLTITKSKYSPVRWNGEEQLALGPTGQYNKILADQFTQSFRWLANQVEVDLFTAGYKAASRAYGTAGTPPFAVADDLSDFAGVNRILDENGAPMMGRQLVVGSAARFNLEGKQKVFFKANEAGTDGLLRDRILNQAFGFQIGYSHAAPGHTKGAGAGYLVDNTGGYAAGTEAIHIDTGTGTILAGDVVTFAGDSNKYVIGSGFAGDGDGDIVLNDPGLRAALADNAAMTVGNSYTASLAFTSNALMLAARAPALPDGGDSADDRMFVQDPISGLTFEISLYREYRRIRYEVALAWGVGAVKSEHIALLLG